MQWLISTSEPLALHAPVLSDELLRAGIIREIVDQLPWYKKTRHMEVILAGHLINVLRSGFAHTYIQKQMEKLDIPADAAGRLLRTLEAKGACQFGEPHYFYNPVVQSASFGGRVAVQSQYLEGRLMITDTLAECLRLLDEKMAREAYLRALEKRLGSADYARTACQSLAQMGLLMSCDSFEPSVEDYGPSRWNIEMSCGERLLDAAAWDKRLDFLQESFRQFFFPSHDFFPTPPVSLCGDYHVTTMKGDADYFRELSFKLQRFSDQLTVDLRVSSPFSGAGWREFRLRAPTLFAWRLTFDLRGGRCSPSELAAFVESDEYSSETQITILTDAGLPAVLIPFCDRANFKLYFCEGRPDIPESPKGLRRAVGRALLPTLRREGCGAGASLYMNGRGEVYTCALEGGDCLAHIEDGAQVVEERRKSLRRAGRGACRFGVAPHGPGALTGLMPLEREALASAAAPHEFTCP